MNLIDYQLVKWLNSFAAHWPYFDSFVIYLGNNHLLKAGPFVALLGWVWFRDGADTAEHAADTLERRTRLVFGLIASCTSVLFVRILALAVPFRERPLRNPDLNFVLPKHVDRLDIIGWSSFPSDNAAIFFGLATCIFLASRVPGIIAFCHAMLVIAFARVYEGIHYPTDILVGGLIGAGLVSLVAIGPLRAFVTNIPIRLMQVHPASFYALFFVLIFLINMSFEPLYPLVHVLLRLI